MSSIFAEKCACGRSLAAHNPKDVSCPDGSGYFETPREREQRIEREIQKEEGLLACS